MSKIPITIAYSPLTQLENLLEINDTTTKLKNINAVVDLQAGEETRIVLTAGERYDSEDPDDYETCRVTDVDTGTSDVTIERGIEGNQQEWPADTYVRCLPTADMWNNLSKEFKQSLRWGAL